MVQIHVIGVQKERRKENTKVIEREGGRGRQWERGSQHFKDRSDYFFMEVSSEIMAPVDEEYESGQRASLGYTCR